MSMMRRAGLPSLAILGMLALHASPVAAQIEGGRQEVYTHAGVLFGDDLMDTKIAGQTPKLDDDVTYGIRYGYNITNNWNIELSLGQTSPSATHLATTPEEMFTLGAVFDDGAGVPRNYETAYYWYERAAHAGHVEAMNRIGILRAAGRGVP